MRRLLAIMAFAFAGIAAELANPVQCTLLHASRMVRPRKRSPGP